MTIEISGHSALSRTMQDGDMLQADEVVAMLRLLELGWGQSIIEGVQLRTEYGSAISAGGRRSTIQKNGSSDCFRWS